MFLMTKLVFNKGKNSNIEHISFDLECDYYFFIFYNQKIDSYGFYKKDINLCFTSKLLEILILKPEDLMIIYKKNLNRYKSYQWKWIINKQDCKAIQ